MTVAVVLALFPLTALGADSGILGQKLVLKSRGTTQKLVFVSKDPLIPFPLCQTFAACDGGDVCVQGMCHTPNCTAHSQCGLPGIAFCISGVCCAVNGGGTFCL
ncbi:MAG TPA: hypothetical protein VGR62_13560 [Candidatus Binatia bacterium]|jgi:hypothetical protein|nr:hypothetical protein [Candidatus Binatia bacterium]